MSVAVSPYLPAQGLGFNSGQQTDLLDALLASCQKATTNPRLPGYGRNLQPYFTAELLTPRINAFPVEMPKTKGKQKKTKGKSSNSSSSSGSDEEWRVCNSSSPPKYSQAQISLSSKAVPVWAGPTFGIAPAASEIPTPSDFLLA